MHICCRRSSKNPHSFKEAPEDYTQKEMGQTELKNKIVEFANNVDSKLAQVPRVLTDEKLVPYGD